MFSCEFCEISINTFVTVVSFFTKGWVVQKMEPKGNSIELSTFLKYGLTKVKKAPS